MIMEMPKIVLMRSHNKRAVIAGIVKYAKDKSTPVVLMLADIITPSIR